VITRGTQPAPQLYLRSDSKRLQYTPIGRDEAVSEELDVGAFRELFRLDELRERRGAVATADGFIADDFLQEARLLAEDLVGRKAELRKVKEWIKGRDVWSGEAARVGWIAGGPGLGKSLLVALRLPPEVTQTVKTLLTVR
jgi:hypothetical protein